MTIQKPIAVLRRQAEKRNENLEGGRPWRVLDFLLYLLLIMTIVLAVRSVAIDPVRVDGTSMLETLVDGEIMLVDRLSSFNQRRRQATSSSAIIRKSTILKPDAATIRASSA